MLLVDTKEKVFMRDEDIKAQLANMRPYGEWLAEEVSYHDLYVNPETEDLFRQSIDDNFLPFAMKKHIVGTH